MKIKHTLEQFMRQAAQKAFDEGKLSAAPAPDGIVEIEEPKHISQGDFSTNFAMAGARTWKMAPRKIAKILIECMPENEILEKVEAAGPGFINFFLRPSAFWPVVDEVLEKDTAFGSSDMGKGQKIQIEFVSSNPTGPLHIGHGRGAAVGDSTANILSFSGFEVFREYYVNDAGRQIRTLGLSVLLRARQLSGEELDYPEDCYQGDYIWDLAREILAQEGNGILELEESEGVARCGEFAAPRILEGIKTDLENFQIHFDNWFSEQSLYDDNKVQDSIQDFRDKKIIYEKDGALWFRTTDYGDEKDRVVVKNDGLTTYFASDIAYHRDKYDRGFSRLIDVWGADHHGYINRMKAAIMASGKPDCPFDVILIQLVNLLRAGNPVQMSTRAGEFITLKEIIDEVGSDAARFLFLSRSHDSGLDFDLETAKQKSSENPVYYVQYVHARITGILAKAKEQGIIDQTDMEKGLCLEKLTEQDEITLMKLMAKFGEQVEKSAETLHPHLIFTYLMSLAAAFHGYYNRHKVIITEDRELSCARLSLVLAVKKVIRNALSLLGVSAPDRM